MKTVLGQKIGHRTLGSEEILSELQGEVHQLQKELRAARNELIATRMQLEEYSWHLDQINRSAWWRVGMFLGEAPQRILEIFNNKQADKSDDPSTEALVPIPFSFNTRATPFLGNVGIFIHAFNLELLPEIIRFVRNVQNFSLYVSTDTEEKKIFIEMYLRYHGFEKFLVRKIENRGRDIAAKFYGFADAYSQHEFVLHLHTKKSSHTRILGEWGPFLLENLIGSKQIIESIAELFYQNPGLGIVAPPTFPFVRPSIGWGKNLERCQEIATRIGTKITVDTQIDFPAGSMFWARTKALQPLLDLKFDVSSFEEEKGQLDGTLAHALERMIFLSAESAGLFWLHAGKQVNPSRNNEIYEVSSLTELETIIVKSQRRLSG